MMHSEPSWPTYLVNFPSRNLHWFIAGIGVLASFGCGAFLLSHPFGAPSRISAAVNAAAHQASAGLIGGIAGTTFAAATPQSQGDEIVTPRGALPVQPVVWNKVSTPGCLTVTTENGQKLSFRINGYRPAAKPAAGKTAPTYDLAVSTCTQTGDAVVNAVIEPDAADANLNAPTTTEHSL
jgi:hypothetical protein